MAVKKGTAKKNAPSKKKAPIKKSLDKKAAAKKPLAAKRKLTAIRQRYSKTEIINELAINSGLNRKQVGTVLDELAILISRHVKNALLANLHWQD